MASPAAGESTARVFSIQTQPDGRLLQRLLTFVQPGLESLLGLARLNEMYAAHPDRDGRRFCDVALEALQIVPHASPDPGERLPASGGLVVVANHPFGGVDGLALHSVLARARSDVKLLGNFLLAQIPDLRPDIFFVDPFERPGRERRNMAGMREAIRWVRQGGVLVVFPAGEVSPIRRSECMAEDGPWHHSLTRLIRACAAPVLPAFIEGANSPLFYGLGLLHPRLRTAMLPRELLRRQRSVVRIHFGRVIPLKQFERLEDAEASSYLRLRTYALCARSAAAAPSAARTRASAPWATAWQAARAATTGAAGAHIQAVATARSGDASVVGLQPANSKGALAAEMRDLIARHDLVDHERFSIILTTARESPAVLDAIGRGRAATFQAAGEGTGESIDRDQFDDYYRQLVLWDREREVVAGGYRLGGTDEILPARGIRGLYTSTLFRFDKRFFDRTGPALELGRSFVVPDYQKDFAPLMLLWKGIGRIVADEPRYLRLFGAVSISREYSEMARALLSGYLSLVGGVPSGGKSAAVPRNPPRFAQSTRVGLRDLARLSVSDLDELIREIENGARGLPVLLRHYLSLNARALGMNVDRSFGDVLDALMLLDLCEVPTAMLARFVGREAAARIGQKALRQSA
jgi:putative hemolysin